ncbi:hypothetical protein [Thermococcus sp.]|uniref:hypothetical protein n=1 Tax=Thermococcus sp. TaxID=35749 RepID=UPI002605DAD9|nr:hypothetical protein [Thermococcus sp.]
MRALTVFGFFLIILLLFGYAYLPSENMNELYQKIPEQVRENSQLIAAYYSSQTGFDSFREYQFALYNPKDRTISIYTFKITKLLKIWPRMTETTISCKTPFNYSVLGTNPEKLKNFKNCNNCRELLYKEKIYRNEEIESIHPEVKDVLERNREYWKVKGIKSSELSVGTVSMYSGDTIRDIGFEGYPGALLLPNQGSEVEKAVWIEIYLKNNKTVVNIHYPRNVTISTIAKYNITNSSLWSPNYTKLQNILSELEKFGKYSKKAWRFKVSIWDPDTVWIEWIIPSKNTYSYLKIGNQLIPIRKIYFSRVYITHCSDN